MHRFVTSAFFLFASSLIACSSGHTTSSPGSSEGALSDKGGGDPGGKGGGGTGGGSCDPGKGDGCFTQAVPGCQDYGQLKTIVAEKCGVPGITIADIEFGPACGDGKADGVKYTCCAAPPPPPACKDFPIPPEICKDPAALKDYAVKTCQGLSPGLSFPDGDPCSPKAVVECCEDAPPPPPPTK